MATTIEIPSFRFSGFYYAEILQDLMIWLRANVPELTDEDPEEPGIQLLKAFSLVGHLSTGLIDFVALETLLPTARLRESVRGHLALINYRLKQPTPAVADLLLRLPSAVTAPTTLFAGARFATEAGGGAPAVVYELGADLAVSVTNKPTGIVEDDGGVLTDRTADFTTAGPLLALWGGVPAEGDALYVGHSEALWNRFDLSLDVEGDVWGDDDHVWEYYGGSYDDGGPTLVTDLGGGLIEFDLTSILGSSDRHGTTIRIRSRLTGAYEDVISTFAGGTNKGTTGLLGQVSVSTSTADYSCGAAWKELPAPVEEGADGARKITFGLPESVSRQWRKTTINGVEAYWIRLRAINVVATAPTVDVVQISEGTQWLKITVTQGETVVDDPAGSSTGLSRQKLSTSRDGVVEGTLVVEVDEGGGFITYTEAEDLLSSTSTSRDYTVDYDDEGRAIVTFGDGINGKIPPAGVDNFRLTYRRGAETDGNVGSGAISVNRSGSALVAACSNPRPAVGWKPAEGSTPADLARVKIAGPASLRTLRRALTADDVEELAEAWTRDDGSEPVERAKAVEEGYGPKTIKLILVGAGGGAIPSEALGELDEYFNGNPITGASGVLVLNSETTSINYTQRPIDVTMTISGGSVEKVAAALLAYLSPTAVDTSGDYEHDFGGEVVRARLISAAIVAGADDVTLTVPAANVPLGAEELPIPGTILVTQA